MSVPKQATVNRWVNFEAVVAYAEKLSRWAQREELDGRPYLATGLRDASAQLSRAALIALAATRAATDAAYDRLYERQK
jgi:hypothetical protein